MTPEEEIQVVRENQSLKVELIELRNSAETLIRENLEAEIRQLKQDYKFEKDRCEKIEKENWEHIQQAVKYEDQLARFRTEIKVLRDEGNKMALDSLLLAKSRKDNFDLVQRHGKAVDAWDLERKSLSEKLGVFSHEVLDPECAGKGCQSAKLKQVEWELRAAKGSLLKVKAEEIVLTKNNADLQEKLENLQALLKRLYEAHGAVWNGAADLLPKGVSND